MLQLKVSVSLRTETLSNVGNSVAVFKFGCNLSSLVQSLLWTPRVRALLKGADWCRKCVSDGRHREIPYAVVFLVKYTDVLSTLQMPCFYRSTAPQCLVSYWPFMYMWWRSAYWKSDWRRLPSSYLLTAGLSFGYRCSGAIFRTYKFYRQPTKCNNNGLLIIPISSTCFGRWFRPSSGALDCVLQLVV